jgi:transcriptional regulator with XRE-family HTH domain
MVLVRHEIGDVLRDVRLQKGQTLRQVAGKASVALGYLSEVERGQKEASSEILASVAEALDTPISVIMREVSDRLADLEGISLDAPTTLFERDLDAEFEASIDMPVIDTPTIPDTLPDELLAEFDSELSSR